MGTTSNSRSQAGRMKWKSAMVHTPAGVLTSPGQLACATPEKKETQPESNSHACRPEKKIGNRSVEFAIQLNRLKLVDGFVDQLKFWQAAGAKILAPGLLSHSGQQVFIQVSGGVYPARAEQPSLDHGFGANANCIEANTGCSCYLCGLVGRNLTGSVGAIRQQHHNPLLLGPVS